MHPEHSERTELPGQLPHRQVPVLEPLADLGLDLVVDEVADGVADGPVVLADEVVRVEQAERGDGCVTCHGSIVSRFRAAWAMP